MLKLLSQAVATLRVFGFLEFITRTKAVVILLVKGQAAYQSMFTATIEELSKKHKLFVDIGAANGIVSLNAAQYFEQVIAIEPAKHHHEALDAIISNKSITNIDVYKLAVGPENGTAKLGLSSSNPDDNSLFNRSDIEQYIEVEQKTLDSLLANELELSMVIKMDVQGFEPFILQGASSVLKHRPVVITEFWPWGIKSAGSEPAEFLESFKDKGYKIYDLSGKEYTYKTLLKACRLGASNDAVVADLLLIHKDAK